MKNCENTKFTELRRLFSEISRKHREEMMKRNNTLFTYEYLQRKA